MRRAFVGIFTLAFFCLLLIPGASSVGMAAEKEIVIRVGSTLVKSHPHSEAAYRLADVVNKKTGGRIKIQYHPHSQLGKASEQISGVRMGSQEAFFGANGRMNRIIKAMNILSPSFGFKSKEEKLALINSPYFDTLREQLRKKFSLKVLNFDWFRGYRNLLTQKPVMKLGDLKGIKLRVPPSPAKVAVWKALGASPTPISSKEQFMALKEGVIDGVEHNVFSIRGKHLDEVAKHFLLTQHEPIYAGFTVNQGFWNALSESDRKIIMDALSDCRTWLTAKFDSLVREYKEKMEKEEGVTFRSMEPSERDRWFKAAEKAVDALEKSKGWWPEGTMKKFRAKDPQYYRPM